MAKQLRKWLLKITVVTALMLWLVPSNGISQVAPVNLDGFPGVEMCDDDPPQYNRSIFGGYYWHVKVDFDEFLGVGTPADRLTNATDFTLSGGALYYPHGSGMSYSNTATWDADRIMSDGATETAGGTYIDYAAHSGGPLWFIGGYVTELWWWDGDGNGYDDKMKVTIYFTDRCSTHGGDDNPSFTVDKSADPLIVGDVGDEITYTVVITNTGDITLTSVVVADQLPDGSPIIGLTEYVETLTADDVFEPGETWTYTIVYAVTQDNYDNHDILVEGDVVNRVSVTVDEVPDAQVAEATTEIIGTNNDVFEDGDTGVSTLTITGMTTCYGVPTVLAPVPEAGVFTIELPDWAEGEDFEIDFEYDAFATADPVPAFTHQFEVDTPLFITITAEDDSEAVYTILVNWIETNDVKQLTHFWFELPATGDGVYDNGNLDSELTVLNESTKQVTINVPWGVDVTTLVAHYTLDNEPASWMTHSEDPIEEMESGVSPPFDYSTPVAFTVHASDCSTVEYFVTVVVDDNADNFISLLSMDGDGYDNCMPREHPGFTGPSWDFEDNGGIVDFEGYTEVHDAGNLVTDPIVLTAVVPFGTDPASIVLDWTTLDLTLATHTQVPVMPIVALPATIAVTVTAENMISKRYYSLEITEGPASPNNILGAELETNALQVFNFPDINFNGEEIMVTADSIAGDVNQTEQRIDVLIPWNLKYNGDTLYKVEELVACFDFSEHACVYVIGPETTDKTYQVSCETPNDFTEPVHYTVIAQNGDERYYNIFVDMVPADTDNWIGDFMSIGLKDCNGNPAETEVLPVAGLDTAFTIRVPNNAIDPDIIVTYDIPELADGLPASGFNLFDEAVEGVVTIVVTAEDGTPAEYTIEIDLAEPNDVKEIVEFSFEPLVDGKGNGQFINGYVANVDAENEYELTVAVPYDTDVTQLVASFILDDQYATISHSEDIQHVLTSGQISDSLDYTTPVAFTVFAEDCSTVEYFVTVIPALEEVGTELGLDVSGTQYDNCECLFKNSILTADVDIDMDLVDNVITVTAPAGTVIDTLFLNVVVDAVVTSSDVTVVNDTVLGYYVLGAAGEFDVMVTAPDGVDAETYTIEIEAYDPLGGKKLLEFYFTKTSNPTLEMDTIWGMIDTLKNRIDVYVPYGTPDSLIVNFVQSPMACVYLNGPLITDKTEQCSGMAPKVDFSDYQTYTVIAQNGEEAYYNVYVEVLDADTDTFLNSLVATNLEECFGEFVYTAFGVYDGTDIDIPVKTDITDVTAVEVVFDVPEKAVVTMGEVVLVPVQDTVSGLYVITVVLDLTTPVEITVTAQDTDVDPVVYTVSAVGYTPSNAKRLLSYDIDQAKGTYLGDNIFEVYIPWTTDHTILETLVADFKLSAGAKMTHSEDDWILQESGYTYNDFTYPVAFTVWAEDCTTEEFFVIVHITPDTNTGISQFSIPYDGCFCDSDATHMRIDDFAKRIYVQIPFADMYGNPVSLSSLVPMVIGLAEGATVSPAAGVAKNFANGPVTYTVTAPDGVTKVAWTVSVENPPCDGTDVLDFSFNGGVQFEWTYGDKDVVYENPIIDTDNHTISVMLLPGTDLSSLSYQIDLECGATICCNAGACAGQVIDFSGDDHCHVCVVTAQDKSVTQEWTVCVEVADDVTPKAYTTSVLAMNCSDSVMVYGDKDGGKIYIVDAETAALVSQLVNSWSGSTSTMAGLQSWMAMNMEARGLVSSAVSAHMGASADYPYADSTVAIMTDGIYKGKYYAVLIDAAGNVSCASEEALYIDVCVKEVANLCDLRAASPVYEYIVTGEVLVSYEEGDFKFIQDDNCGIKVIDNLGAWPNTYGVGTGLTNIKGTIDKTGNEYKFYPVCCYSPEKSSTGNTIAPVELTWDEFLANCYSHGSGYESMLVRITTPMIAFDDYSSANTNWVYNMLDLATIDARDNYEYFIQQTFNANYIGDVIPTDPTIYQGIRTNADWGDIYGLITPRSTSDIIKVASGILIADPNPAAINGVLPGSCGSVMIDIINQGVGNLVISALYLNDAAGSDEFELMDPEQVPFILGTWETQSVEVQFCPNNAGPESTTLLVEYGDGKVIEIPINGTTVLINDTPFCEQFDDNAFANNSTHPDYGWTNNLAANNGQGATAVGWHNALSRYGGSGYQLFIYSYNGYKIWQQSPGFNVTGSSKFLTFWHGKRDGWYAGWGGTTKPTEDLRRIYISNDGQQTWTEIWNITGDKIPEVFDAANYGGGYQQVEISLAAYEGETVYFRFQVDRTSNDRAYWLIDDLCVADLITVPIYSAPSIVDFGGVQVGETGTASVSITNAGVSVLKIKKVELMAGPQFGITDGNTYPVEILSGKEAYAVNGQESVTLDLSFSPTDIGVFTGKILVTYGMYSDQVAEINLSGEGLSCATATEAFVGENWAPGQNIWFTYTAEKFQIVNINSCHPFNTVEPYAYSFDTYMYIYDDCNGNLLAENDDLEWDACPYNRASSGASLAMNEGETIKIFFPWVFSSASDDIGFYMNIEPSYPIDGDVCETAIPLTLPVVNHFGSTAKFADDYDMSPCSPYSNYMDGNDKVYSITLDVEGYLTANILGAYGSVHVLDKCPVEELEKRNCKLFTSGPNGGEATKRIQAGTYYVIVSTWAPPQTVDYLLNMSFQGLGIDDNALTSSMKVYPNPTQGMFTVSISNAEASDLTLELVNISGQTVYRNEVKSVYSYTEEIDASSFAKGVYYLKVNDGEEVKIEKVVIQ